VCAFTVYAYKFSNLENEWKYPFSDLISIPMATFRSLQLALLDIEIRLTSARTIMAINHAADPANSL
jgi:hypothetical protein